MTIFEASILVEAALIIGVIGAVSLKFRLLDAKGVAASLPVGYLIYVFGGRMFFAILLTFYGISLIATWLRVKHVGVNVMDKEWVRSWRNVAANGVVATAVAVLGAIEAEGCAVPYLAAYVGAVGTSFADTLATEIGLFYPRDPRVITTMKPAPRGTPGAVSPYGYAASVLALTILAGMLALYGKASLILPLYIAGIVGVTMDSILGATVQARYRCTVCGKETESSVHCGKRAEKISGITLISTHTVNLLSTLTGATIAFLIAAL